jgi:hypothetical protein
MSKEAMKLALEIAIDYMNDRLEDHDCKYQRHPATEAERINILADIETVKEALAKQEQGEPVAYIRDEENICYQYTSLQPNRSPLTKDQLNVLWKDANKEYGRVIWRFARAIEAAHGIKE